MTILIGVQKLRTENCLWSSMWRKHVVFSNSHWGVVLGLCVYRSHSWSCTWMHVSCSNQAGLAQRSMFIPLLSLSRCRGQRNTELKVFIWKHASRNEETSDGSSTHRYCGCEELYPTLGCWVHSPVTFSRVSFFYHIMVKSAAQYGINTNKCQTLFPFPAAKRFAYFCSQHFLKHILYKCIWRPYSCFPRKMSQMF